MRKDRKPGAENEGPPKKMMRRTHKKGRTRMAAAPGGFVGFQGGGRGEPVNGCGPFR